MENTKKHFYVISHTHWDREWYMPFSQFRLRLVDLIDSLFDILEDYPTYIFHLDAQTIVLEDYLELCPDKEGLLKKYIALGNIIVGPWYLQNDYYLTSGESTIRNLLIGMSIAENFGNCSKVGYAPDQFGNPDQLPQILNNFGIDTFIFGRGNSLVKRNEKGELYRAERPVEFVWKGTDGSEVLAVHMRFWYNNAQRFSADIEKSKLLLTINAKNFEDVGASPYLLMMNGVDHLQAQENLLPILQKLREEMPDCDVQQTSMQRYMDDLKSYFKSGERSIQTITGALRYGPDYEMLRGCWSSKSYIKTWNVRAQTLLENKLEPLYSMLEMAGLTGVYRRGHFRYLWKSLLKNHPHDSICCCSCDEIAEHMEDQYKTIMETGETMFSRGMELAAQHTQVAHKVEKDKYLLTMMNPTEDRVEKVCEAELIFPSVENVNNFTITDGNGVPIEFEVIARREDWFDMSSPVNLPGSIAVDVYTVLFRAAVQSMAIGAYIVTPIPGNIEVATTCPQEQADSVENEFYRIFVEKGIVCCLDKRSGKTIKNFITFEDKTDRGDSYIFVPNPGEEARFAGLSDAKVTFSSGLRQEMTLNFLIGMKSRFDFGKNERIGETVEIPCQVRITLEKGQNRVDLNYCVKNAADDHRLRLCLSSNHDGDDFVSDVLFDIVQNDKSTLCPGTGSETFFASTFASECVPGGIGVFTEGLHEIEKTGENLYLTIVRATGLITRRSNGKPVGGKRWEIPGNQLHRELTGRIGVTLCSGDAIEDRMLLRAKQFRVGLPVCFTSADPHKFVGGRTAVQDTKLKELFYLDDPYETASIPDNLPAVVIDNQAIAVSALKRVETGDGLIVRFWNMSNSVQTAKVQTAGKIFNSFMDERKDSFLGENTAVLSLVSKEIKTLLIEND